MKLEESIHVDMPLVNRVEVIDHRSRPYFKWPRTVIRDFREKTLVNVFVELQDDGKTLKVFLEDK